MKKLLALAFLLAASAMAQPSFPYVLYLTSPPVGACGNGYIVVTGSSIYGCVSGTWALVGDGSGSSSLTIGTTTISGGTTNQLLFDNAGVAGEVTKCNSGVYSTNGSGVPSCSSTLPSGLTIPGAAAISAGSSAPALTPGTGGPIALIEGTAPSVCQASTVDCVYSDSTQHGLLANFNNAGYLPLVQGPASNTSGHIAVWSGTNGGKLIDGGAVPTSGCAAIGSPTANQLLMDNGSGCPTLATSAATASGLTNSGRYIGSLNGAASTPPLVLNGTWFSGGSATTTQPQLLLSQGGAVTTAWSTNGTGYGVVCSSNSPNAIDVQTTANQSNFSVTCGGTTTVRGGLSGLNFIAAGPTFALRWTTLSQMFAPSDGIVELTNNAATGFTRLDFGVTGATGPALAATIQTNPIISVRDATGGNTASLDAGLGVSFATVAGGITEKSGSNARIGTGTLSGGTLAVANTSITANSMVFVQDTGGGVLANIGALYIASQTAGVGFTVTSSNAIDTSTFRYWIIESQ